MSFLAPGWLLVGAVAAVIVAGLHLVAFVTPPEYPLPTARFVPAGALPARARALRPRDLLLLALRALAVLLLAAALARPVLAPARARSARVLLVDRSRAVGDARALADSVRALRRDGDVVVLFDSVARRAAPADGVLAPSGATGSLSAALAAGLRAAASLGARADSAELVLVSPLAAEEWDGATARLRALWPGRVRLVRLPARRDSAASRGAVALVGETGDPLGAALPSSAEGASGALAPVARVVRGVPTSADSAWARAGEGRALVVWPAAPASLGWPARERVDTVGALVMGDDVVVAPFARAARLPSRTAHAVARWVDGEPAAAARPLGAGCVRDVAIGVPIAGDLVLRDDFRRVVARLTAPCGAPPGPATPLADSLVARLAGAGAEHVRPPRHGEEGSRAPLVPWLLGAALLLLAAELPLRRRAEGA